MSEHDAVAPFGMPTRPPLLRVTRPRWVFVFFLINIAVWLLMTLAGGSQNTKVLVDFGASYGPLIAAGELWRLFTANFIHIGFLHIAFNSWALYILGQECEALFGSSRFVLIYLLSGLSGSIASFSLDTQAVLSAGASTSIFGLIGALVAFFARNRRPFGAMGRQRLNNYIFFIVLNLAIGLTVPGIGNLGHMGGLVGGLLLGWLMCPVYSSDGTDDVQAQGPLVWTGVGLFVIALVIETSLGVLRWNTAGF